MRPLQISRSLIKETSASLNTMCEHRWGRISGKEYVETVSGDANGHYTHAENLAVITGFGNMGNYVFKRRPVDCR